MAPTESAALTLDHLRRYVTGGHMGSLHPLGGEPEWRRPIAAAANDSRDLVPDGLFVALPGERTDGHRFVPAAYAAGAAVLLVARPPDGDLVATPGRDDTLPPALIWQVDDPLAALQGLAAWWRARFDLPVVGITGSVGKTTAKAVLTSALDAAALPALASPRSFNNEIGLPLTLLSLANRHRAAVLEMGIYDVGDIAFLARIARQTIGVVLNVEAVHLERAGSIERIARAKAELITTLPRGGTAVLNHDDPRVRAMAEAAPGPVSTFGLEAGADWQGLDLQALPDGLALTIAHRSGRHKVRSRLPGRHHAAALLAAAAVMETLGVPIPRIVAALEAVPVPASRQRLLRRADGGLLIDDTYNASPLSMLAALDLLAEQDAPRRVAILADMLELGPLAEQAHRQVGARAAEVVDLLLAVGPLSRHAAEAASGCAIWFEDKAALRTALPTLLRKGDAMLVKGSRGMAMEDVVGWLCDAG